MAYSLMFLIAMFDNNVDNSDNLLSLQKVLRGIHHAIQLKAEIKLTTEMVSNKRLHVTAAWIEEKVNFQKVKDAQLLSSNESQKPCKLKIFYFVAILYSFCEVR